MPIAPGSLDALRSLMIITHRYDRWLSPSSAVVAHDSKVQVLLMYRSLQSYMTSYRSP